MKQFYIFTFLLCVGITQRAHAQQTIFSDDFESGSTNDADLVNVNGWQVFGNDFPIVKLMNTNSGGYNSSNWYAEIRTTQTDCGGCQQIQQVHELISGETYEFKIQIKRSNAWASARIQALYGNTVLAETNNTIGNTGYAEKIISFTATNNGNHKFKIKKDSGAGFVQIDNVEITCTTCTTASVDDFSKLKFTISPNPAQDIIRVTSNDILKKMELYSLTGAKILEVKGNNYINMNGISSGIYLLKVHSDNGSVATKKLIKN
jgi:hypothetical protein